MMPVDPPPPPHRPVDGSEGAQCRAPAATFRTVAAQPLADPVSAEGTASRWCAVHDEPAAECWSAECLAAAEAKCEGLAPFCCNNPDCPVHGDRIDPAELDAARLVGDMAEAEVVALRARVQQAEAERAKWERLAMGTSMAFDTQQARAESAEAERDALRERVEALFAGGPDTPCRTTWREDWPLAGPTECVEVPMADLRAALDG